MNFLKCPLYGLVVNEENIKELEKDVEKHRYGNHGIYTHFFLVKVVSILNVMKNNLDCSMSWKNLWKFGLEIRLLNRISSRSM